MSERKARAARKTTTTPHRGTDSVPAKKSAAVARHRPYKFVVQAVVQEFDADGNVTGEGEAQPVVLYGCAALEKWARDFPVLLEKAADGS